MLTLKGTGRLVTLDETRRTLSVEVRGWRALKYSKIKKGKRAGEALPPVVTMPTDAIRKVKVRLPIWPFRGKLTIKAPGYGDHWNAHGRQRTHRIFYRDAPACLLLLFGIDLTTANNVVDDRVARSARYRKLRNRVKEQGRPALASRRRRGELVRTLSDDPRFQQRAAKATPVEPPRPPVVVPRGLPVGLADSPAVRAARRQRRAAGLPPA